MLTEKEYRCCLEAASHYLNGNVRDKSRIFAPSELEIFVTNDSQVPDASCQMLTVTKSSMANVRIFGFNLCKELLRELI